MDFSNFSANDLLLTANRRLQEYWQHAHNQYQQAHGLKVWRQPAICSWLEWQMQCWQRLQMQELTSPFCLSRPQAQHILEKCVIEQATPLLNVSATSEHALAALELLHHYQLSPFNEHFADNDDIAWFQKLAQRFNDYCQNHHVIIEAQIGTELIKAFQQHRLIVPTKLYHAGFTEWTPEQQALLTLLQNQGCQIIAVSGSVTTTQPTVVAINTQVEEWQAQARWAKHAWQTGKTSIACVIPSLADHRAQIERIFLEQFSAEEHFPVNISGGKPLALFPVIHTIFLCLRLSQHKMSLDEVGSWLRSPYLANAYTARSERALLDWKLRRNGETTVRRDWLLRNINAEKHPEVIQLLEHCQLEKRKKSARQWALDISQLLVACGWPGEQALNSIEYQCTQRWLRLLDEFTQESAVREDMTASEAIQLLHSLASHTMFQTQSELEPIQVIGLLEAIGHPFEMLWISGLHDEAWPTMAKPNLFIPLSLQKQHRLPHANAERELHYCNEVMQMIATHVPEWIASYPMQTGDMINGPSRLLIHFPIQSISDLALAPLINTAATIQQQVRTHNFSDEIGLPVTDTEIIKGGSALLKSMATCPFQAFARYRLGTSYPNKTMIGLSGSERGSLVHWALEAFWQDTRCLANLLAYSTDEYHDKINEATLAAIMPLIREKSGRFEPAFFECERDRLFITLHRYLELEKTRPDFTVVGIESLIETTIGKIPLTLRCDRIDETAEGERFIIDYKTADIQIKDWFSARPTEPQLPLYAISQNEVDALVIAHLKIHSIGFKGVARDDVGIDGILPLASCKRYEVAANWSEQIRTWREVLTELAEQFQQGIATVDPKLGTQSCTYCDLQGFCRVENS